MIESTVGKQTTSRQAWKTDMSEILGSEEQSSMKSKGLELRGGTILFPSLISV